ncbi:MAG: hypothetical protein U0174_10535 [Polyangiaceae bacterium]
MLPTLVRSWKKIAFLGPFVGIALLSGATSSCAEEYDPGKKTTVVAPDFATYDKYVDGFLNARCGTLDCHGQPGRPFRSYGYRGLRIFKADGGLVPGQGTSTSTPEERLSNYYSIIALEPEEMSRVIARNGERPETLLFVRKPLLLERHKGGPALSIEDNGYKCITAWLRAEPGKPFGEDPLTSGGPKVCALAAALR